jgi:hypothetical protein
VVSAPVVILSRYESHSSTGRCTGISAF